MRKWLKWIGVVVLGLIGLCVLVWGAARVMGPDRAQREALALMQQPWQPPGRNAFDALWLLPYVMPEAEVAGITERDLQRMREMPLPGADGQGGLSGFVSEAAETYPAVTPSNDDFDLFCETRSNGCLATVRGNLSAYEALVERHAALLDRIAGLSAYGHIANRLPHRIDAPLPRMNLLRLGVTANAVTFARGEVDAALAATCRDIDTWRRLGEQNDFLIGSIAAGEIATEGHGRLLVEMLRALPLEHPLPAECGVALAPAPTAELSMCTALRGEFALVSGALASMPEVLAETSSGLQNRVLAPLIFNPVKTTTMVSTQYSPACAEAEAKRLQADLPIVAEPVPVQHPYLRFECIDNFVGCIIGAVASPSYEQYRHRRQDLGARLQVLGTLAWLREHAADPGTLAERVAARPDALKSPARDVEVGPSGWTLQIRQYDNSHSDYWDIPLPDGLASPPPD